MEIIQSIQNDPAYALRFALDNNLEAIRLKLLDKGYAVSSKAEAFSVISDLVSLRKFDTITYIFNVPYINTATNGTGGLSDFFIKNSAPPETPSPIQTRTFNWSGLLTTVGVVLTSAGVATSGNLSGTAAETEAEKTAREAAEAEAEAKKKKTIIIVSIVVGVIVVGLIIWLVVRKKKKKD